jgi:hypothetical protein
LESALLDATSSEGIEKVVWDFQTSNQPFFSFIVQTKASEKADILILDEIALSIYQNNGECLIWDSKMKTHWFGADEDKILFIESIYGTQGFRVANADNEDEVIFSFVNLLAEVPDKLYLLINAKSIHFGFEEDLSTTEAGWIALHLLLNGDVE